MRKYENFTFLYSEVCLDVESNLQVTQRTTEKAGVKREMGWIYCKTGPKNMYIINKRCHEPWESTSIGIAQKVQ